MTTRQLYYLVTISDLGSLSSAAQVLGVSQPALSKFLTGYEKSLGFLIFLRYHKKLSPTAAGKYVLEYAQKILDEQTRMLQNIRALTDSNHARIRLATAPNRGAIIYSRIYNQFSRRYPNVSLTLTELYASDQASAIAHGQIDLAIGSGKTSDRVTDLPFAYEELLVSLPISHPLVHASRIQLSDLQDTPFVLQGNRHSIRILAEELFLEAGFHPVVVFESNDVILVDSMLHQAVGVGLVSQAHVFPCEELVYRPLDPPIYQTLHIRYPREHTLTEAEQYLAGLLIRERLSDSRYKAIPSGETEALMEIVDLDKGRDSNASAPVSDPVRAHIFHNTAPEITLNTQLLQYVIAIVDEKSLTRAAEKYYLTQPALSRYLHAVESMICTQLFTRVHNRLVPTNAGKVFVNFARNILQMEAEMMERLHNYKARHGGGIYIQCDPDLLPYLDSARKHFAALQPGVTLFIGASNQEETQEALLNASADFGLYFSCRDTHPVLDCLVIAKSQLVYCFGSNTPAGWQKDAPIPKPLSSRHVMLGPVGSTLRAEQERLYTELFDSSPTVVCEGQAHILQLLSTDGTADTILPEDFLSLVSHARSTGFDEPQTLYLLLACHPGRSLPAVSKDLVYVLGETLRFFFRKTQF